MFLKLKEKYRQPYQQGNIMLISVIVILVTMTLSLSLVKILQSGSEQISIDVLSARAFALANSGADRVLVDIYTNPENPNNICSSDTVANPPASVDKNLSSELRSQSLCSFETLTCKKTDSLYIVTSRVQCKISECDAPDCLRVSRAVEVRARK